MKKVAVIYSVNTNPASVENNKKTILSIFNNTIEVENYFLDEIDRYTPIVADAYLLYRADLMSRMRDHIDDYKTIIILEKSLVMQKSLQKSGVDAAMELPSGNTVLVVNDSIESSMQTLYMLHRCGVTHVDLLPFDPKLTSTGAYEHIQYAITPNEEYLVPKNIPHVLNCLPSLLDFNTMHSLAELLDIHSEEISRNLVLHMNNLIPIYDKYQNIYLDTQIKEQLLNLYVNNSQTPIFVMNDKQNLIYMNLEAETLMGKYGEAAITCELLKAYTSDEQTCKFDGEQFMIEKEEIRILDQIIGCTFTLHTENTLHNIENKINRILKQKGLYAKYRFNDIVGKSAIMQKAIHISKQAASTDFTVIIRGESGTGKELFAQSIHNHSKRKNGPFIAINCASIPDALLESQLFGYEEGTFTGGSKGGKPGLFEQANNGTIFLDEIGNISLNTQSNLLRVLQEKQVMRLGSEKLIDVDVRIIAATNKNLEDMVEDGSFRHDLFYRLNVLPVNIPPLRQRMEDILPLSKAFLKNSFSYLSDEDKRTLTSYSWPGNVRQLENACMYFVALKELPAYLYTSAKSEKPEEEFTQPTLEPFVLSPANSVQEAKEQIDIEILNIISKSSNSLRGIGRPPILKTLKDLNIQISDNRLRQELTDLRNKGYIEIHRGRGGCMITDKGLSLINERGGNHAKTSRLSLQTQ